MNHIMKEYVTLEQAYNFFNARLFGGRLPDCLITIHHQGTKSRAFFSGDRFHKRKGKGTIDEIAMNPDAMDGRTDLQILSTLVHEMCHVEQHHFGKPSRNGYHNKQWGDMMKAVGLYPSTTGEKGAPEVGQSCTHYIIKGGAFETHAKKFLEGHELQYASLSIERTKGASKNKNKTAFECPGCGLKAWAKAEAKLACVDCEEELQPVE